MKLFRDKETKAGVTQLLWLGLETGQSNCVTPKILTRQSLFNLFF